MSVCCLQDESTALHLACQGGHVDVVKLLLDSHADIDAADKVRVVV